MYHYDFTVAFDRGLEWAIDQLDKNKNLIAEVWRGWNAKNNNLAPPINFLEDINVSISDVAFSGVHNEDKKEVMSLSRIRGKCIHKVYELLFTTAKDFVYNSKNNQELTKIFDYLIKVMPDTLDLEKLRKSDKLLDEKFNKAQKQGTINNLNLNKIKTDMEKLWRYESILLSARFLYHLSNSHKNDGRNLMEQKENFILEALTFEVAREVDGRRLGLSGRSELDLLSLRPRKTIIEIKTGEENHADKLQVTGYALARESEFGYDERIDIGAILYIKFSDDFDLPFITCEVFPIDTKLRVEFINKRDKYIENLKEKYDR